MIDLEAIRARDATQFEMYHRSCHDRRALLAYVDALAAENATLRSRLADYELLKRAVNETGDCLPDCDSYAHNEQCPNVNNHVVLQDKQREIESLRSRLAEAEKANGELNIEVSRLYACRDELQDVTRAMDDPAVNNLYSLVDAIHKMKRADAAQECPKGAVSVLNPQGTEETGIDRPAAPIFDEAERALLVTRAENAEAALETCDLLRIEAMNACTEANERHSRYVKAVGELAGMAARLAEAERDAARYREVWNSWPLTFGEMLQSGYGVYPIENKAQGDAAIDAAMGVSHAE